MLDYCETDYALFFHLCCQHDEHLNYLEYLQNRFDRFAEDNRFSEHKAVTKAVKIVALNHFGSYENMLDYYATSDNYHSRYYSAIETIIKEIRQ